jgi:hypothetical protein
VLSFQVATARFQSEDLRILARLSLLPDTSRPLTFPSVAGQDAFLPALHKGLDGQGTVESSLAVANHSSSCEKLSPRTASRCADHAVGLFVLGWMYLTMLY